MWHYVMLMLCKGNLSMRFAAIPVVLALCVPSAAVAEGFETDAGSIAPGTVSRDQLRFTAGIGMISRPEYFGSDQTVVGPTGSFSFEYLKFGDFELGEANPNAQPRGLSFGGSFRIVPERVSSDFPELAGQPDVDLSVEVGAGLTYTQPAYEVFADVRYGVIGHESLVGEVGMDLFLRPNDRLTLSAGPRVLWGSDDYAATYFSVDADAASPLEGYDAQGGFLTAGVEIGAEYALDDTWGLEGTVRWDRYIGDAEDSPIVTGGSDDNVTATILATRRFTLDF